MVLVFLNEDEDAQSGRDEGKSRVDEVKSYQQSTEADANEQVLHGSRLSCWSQSQSQRGRRSCRTNPIQLRSCQPIVQHSSSAP